MQSPSYRIINRAGTTIVLKVIHVDFILALRRVVLPEDVFWPSYLEVFTLVIQI